MTDAESRDVVHGSGEEPGMDPAEQRRPTHSRAARDEPEANGELEALLDLLNAARGFDFTAYKRPTLVRRIVKRLESLGLAGVGDYMDHLQVHPEEYGLLFNAILINVTGFFRDPAAWDYLASDVVPRILAARAPAEQIRVWSAGCASGEEAYTIAMIFAEALGPEQFTARVKIYATDVDDEALSTARHASYSAKEVESVPAELLERYFERSDSRIVFRRDLRRCVIFGRHDLLSDAPISRVDLIVCRNTLIYFNAEAQSRILGRFHYALCDTGYLFLGRAESLMSYGAMFRAVDAKRRVFAKVPRLGMRDRLLLVARGEGEQPTQPVTSDRRAREMAFEAAPVAQLVVDPAGVLTLANERARALLRVSASDIGRPLRELEVSHRPTELRSLLDRVYAERRAAVVTDVEWSGPDADPRWFDVHATPLIGAPGETLGAVIAFVDATAEWRLQRELETSRQERETSRQERETAHEELQATVEELETTNEELQSTVEELETTNEELQSTTEELETMNEELHSTNEELEAINDEVRRRSEELNEVNAFLEAILTSLRGAVVVVDRDLHVQVWNPKAQDLWGLRTDEVVGKNFLNLDIGLPVDQLRHPIWTVLADAGPARDVEVEAVNRRGKAILCRVSFSPLVGRDNAVRGAIVVMEDEQIPAPRDHAGAPG